MGAGCRPAPQPWRNGCALLLGQSGSDKRMLPWPASAGAQRREGGGAGGGPLFRRNLPAAGLGAKAAQAGTMLLLLV